MEVALSETAANAECECKTDDRAVQLHVMHDASRSSGLLTVSFVAVCYSQMSRR